MGGNWYVEAKEDIERNKESVVQLMEIIALSGRLRDIAQGYLNKIIKSKKKSATTK